MFKFAYAILFDNFSKYIILFTADKNVKYNYKIQ